MQRWNVFLSLTSAHTQLCLPSVIFMMFVFSFAFWRVPYTRWNHTSFRQRTAEEAVQTGCRVLSPGDPCRPTRSILSLPAFAWTPGEGKCVTALRILSSHDRFLCAGHSVHRQMSNRSSKAGSPKSKRSEISTVAQNMIPSVLSTPTLSTSICVSLDSNEQCVYACTCPCVHQEMVHTVLL